MLHVIMRRAVSRPLVPVVLLVLLALLPLTGCYHYAFEQRGTADGEATARHAIRVPTYLNGLVGTGRVRTSDYCAGSEPIRTELQVRPTDILLSVVTLLIYTPHTLYVTCGTSAAPAPTATRATPSRSRRSPGT